MSDANKSEQNPPPESQWFPPAGQWETISPENAGMRSALLAEAVEFALANESDWPRSLFLADGRYVGNAYVEDRPPHDRPIGVVRPRGGASGVLLRQGRIVAQWGDPERPDTTFSVAKSYLCLLAGIAVDDGLIQSIDDPVAAYMPAEDDGFSGAHNGSITWRHLLQQTSEWRGTLWGIPDSVDRDRRFGSGHDPRSPGGEPCANQRPGSRWEYNDVRVNRLALSLMRVFRRPLPDVLRDRIMNPIGASSTWEWHGYENSMVSIDGRPMCSVSGGGHWGGGLFISARDHARTALLVRANGRWEGRQLLSRRWADELTTPSAMNPLYGYLWWLNTGGELYPSVPHSSLFAIGGGYHLLWIDREHDLVMVARWIDRDCCGELMARILRSIC